MLDPSLEFVTSCAGEGFDIILTHKHYITICVYIYICMYNYNVRILYTYIIVDKGLKDFKQKRHIFRNFRFATVLYNMFLSFILG